MTTINQSQQPQTEQELLKASTSHDETLGLAQSAPSLPPNETLEPAQSAPSLPPEVRALVKEIAATLLETRENRVQMLQEQIEAGTYIVDSAEIARNILGL